MSDLLECEFCGSDSLVMEIAKGPPIPEVEKEVYYACGNCLLGMVTHSLAPWQFLRSKQNGGDMTRFYVHHDFYDPDTGEALQPAPELADNQERWDDVEAWGEDSDGRA